jgi:hypothetical protein
MYEIVTRKVVEIGNKNKSKTRVDECFDRVDFFTGCYLPHQGSFIITLRQNETSHKTTSNKCRTSREFVLFLHFVEVEMSKMSNSKTTKDEHFLFRNHISLATSRK